MRWNCKKVDFRKCTETAHRASSKEAAYLEHSIAIHSISMAGNETTDKLLSAGNSQPGRRVLSVIKKRRPLAISPHFCPVWLKQTFVLDVLNNDNYR